MQIWGEGLQIGLWLSSPQREPNPGNRSVHTKQWGGLHYSSGRVSHREEAREMDGVEMGAEVEMMWRQLDCLGKEQFRFLHVPVFSYPGCFMYLFIYFIVCVCFFFTLQCAKAFFPHLWMVSNFTYLVTGIISICNHAVYRNVIVSLFSF